MQNEQWLRREKLSSLVHKKFHSDNDWVASAIDQRTGENVSVRSIQAWLIHPNRRSSRNCPEWVIKALEDYLKDPKNEELIRVRRDRHEESFRRMKTPLEISDQIRSSMSVDIVTRQIEEESCNLSKWQEEFGTRQGEKLFELNKKLQGSIEAYSKTVTALHLAVDSSKTFEEFRERFREEIRAEGYTNDFLRKTRKAIENNSDEFSNDGTV